MINLNNNHNEQTTIISKNYRVILKDNMSFSK